LQPSWFLSALHLLHIKNENDEGHGLCSALAEFESQNCENIVAWVIFSVSLHSQAQHDQRYELSKLINRIHVLHRTQVVPADDQALI
jgi:hypothetical protein